tara:strand:- start:373 stop:1065 length:693 start_codon:yes stop_codon:yes gene_type:complete
MNKSWGKKNVINFYNLNRDSLKDLYLSESILLKKINKTYIKNILDFGCAVGNFNKIFKKFFKKKLNYIGIDHNEECVKLARKKFSKSKFYIYNNLEKFKEEKFDLVFSTGTLHHIKFYKKILFQMIRCSKRYVFIDCPRLVVSKKKTVKMDLSERFKSKTSPKSRNYVSYYLCNKKNFLDFLKKSFSNFGIYIYIGRLKYNKKYLKTNKRIFYCTVLIDKKSKPFFNILS